MPHLHARLEPVLAELDALMALFREGRLLREGALVVLSGPANAGKSTLFNALLGTNRAIVTDQPGTTRDSIEESFFLDGIVLRLVDTAGLRATGNEIEREGIARARALAKSADVVLFLRDVTAPAGASAPEAPADGPPVIRVYTKADLLSAGVAVPEDGVLLSAQTGQGMDALFAALRRVLQLRADHLSAPAVAINGRHAALLQSARKELEAACSLYDSCAEEAAVPAAAHLREAARTLGSITGRSYTEDLLDNVFGRFCIGK